MSQKGNAILIIIIILAAALGGWYWYSLSKNQDGDIIGCPQDAKICPDGSAVARTGPNCEFAPCPSKNIGSTGSTDSGNSETANWKTYRNEEYGFEVKYPPTSKIISETSKRIVVSDANGSQYAKLGVACVSDPGNSQKIYDDYSIFSQEKFVRTLGSYFETYSDYFGYRDPIATLNAGNYILFVFKGGQYCDVGSCVGEPNRLLGVACVSGLNKNNNKAARCFTALSQPLSSAQEQENYMTNFFRSIQLNASFSNVSDCIGVGETKG